MKIATTRLELTSDEGVSIAEITDEVNAFVAGSGITDGLCVLTVLTPACALSVAPDAEDAVDDLLRLARRCLRLEASRTNEPGAPDAVDPADADRADVEEPGYAPAGVLADCLSVALRFGALHLGNWDGLMLVDAAGPRRHAIDLTLMGP